MFTELARRRLALCALRGYPTTATLATAATIGQRTARRYRLGETVSLPICQAIARALEVSVDEAIDPDVSAAVAP